LPLVFLALCCSASTLRGPPSHGALWDFQQPGFEPHAFGGVALDSGLCSLPVLDVFGALPEEDLEEGVAAAEGGAGGEAAAAAAAAALRVAVPEPDRERWRAYLVRGEVRDYMEEEEALDPTLLGQWRARKRALLRSIARRGRPVVLRGLLDAARTQHTWSAAALLRADDARGDAVLGAGEGGEGGEGATSPPPPQLQITYDEVAAGVRAAGGGDTHGYGQHEAMPRTLRAFVAGMHADRDAELRGHAAHPAPLYAFLGSLPPQLEPALPLRAFADALSAALAIANTAANAAAAAAANANANANVNAHHTHAAVSDEEEGAEEGIGRRQFLVGPAFASTLPHRHGAALQVLLTGAKRWFTDARDEHDDGDGDGAEPPAGGVLGSRNHTLCYCMGRCSALEVLGGRFAAWNMGGSGAASGGGSGGGGGGGVRGGADDCVLRAAEAIFVPDGVCHAVVNCVDSIAYTYEFASDRVAPLPPLPPEPSLGERREL
jgi:hypothetical protein